jgi:vacuolar iron transporter family protein
VAGTADRTRPLHALHAAAAGPPALAVALGITAVALLAGGMIVGRLTGRSMLGSGLRQLALGALAIAVTFAVGSLIGGHAR